MASGMGWTPNKVLALGLIEFISALGVAGGMAVKMSAFLLMCVMCGAIYHKINKWNVPFKSEKSTGWEFDFLLLAATFTLFIRY